MGKKVPKGIRLAGCAKKSICQDNPPAISNAYLKQFKEFRDFQKITINGQGNEADDEQAISNNLSPEDALRKSYKELTAILANELLSTIRSKPPEFFEKLVLDLLGNMGYGKDEDSRKSTRRSGDEGIDGIISEDKLGLDSIYIQAKRWKENSSVGRPDIQKFVGALQGQRAKKGIFITTSKYMTEAYDYVEKIDPKVVLIDGLKLSTLMIEYNIGVSCDETFYLKKIDTDYFEDN